MKNMNKINYKYGDIVELSINETIAIDEFLSAEVTYFTHKRPYVGGPTKAIVTLDLSKNEKSEEIYLCVNGREGKSEFEDGLSEVERFPPTIWKDYTFQLSEKFNYGKSIKVIVTRN
ncbi:hypothetical protein [Psychromonas algicola]|uniref:hypothetical protein n=1 Tax=Psychromonas algicola TaxID=2555642 RepID=UPI0010686825|nr:hypothetical protein [Psychromonas sp. RZ5]TEW52336.1 hypothetical protein E2R67_03225 [Psychromonas sp. RZ5]